MLSSVFCIQSISKVSSSFVGLFEEESDFSSVLGDVEDVQKYLESEPEILAFLEDRMADKASKKELLELLRGDINEYLVNALCFLVDVDLITHIRLFLSTIRSKIFALLNIKQVFVYSSFDIPEYQREKIEKLWKDKLRDFECKFIYAIDKSLRLGIKVQCGNYVEEFTIRASLLQLELKLDSFLSY